MPTWDAYTTPSPYFGDPWKDEPPPNLPDRTGAPPPQRGLAEIFAANQGNIYAQIVQSGASILDAQAAAVDYHATRDHYRADIVRHAFAIDEINDEIFERYGVRLRNPRRNTFLNPLSTEEDQERAFRQWQIQGWDLANTLPESERAEVHAMFQSRSIAERAQALGERNTRRWEEYVTRGGEAGLLEQTWRSVMTLPGIIVGHGLGGSEQFPVDIGLLGAGSMGQVLNVPLRQAAANIGATAVRGAALNVGATALSIEPRRIDAAQFMEEYGDEQIRDDLILSGVFGAVMDAGPGVVARGTASGYQLVRGVVRPRLRRRAAPRPDLDADVTDAARNNMGNPTGVMLNAAQAEAHIGAELTLNVETAEAASGVIVDFPAIAEEVNALNAYISGDTDTLPSFEHRVHAEGQAPEAQHVANPIEAALEIQGGAVIRDVTGVANNIANLEPGVVAFVRDAAARAPDGGAAITTAAAQVGAFMARMPETQDALMRHLAEHPPRSAGEATVRIKQAVARGLQGDMQAGFNIRHGLGAVDRAAVTDMALAALELPAGYERPLTDGGWVIEGSKPDVLEARARQIIENLAFSGRGSIGAAVARHTAQIRFGLSGADAAANLRDLADNLARDIADALKQEGGWDAALNTHGRPPDIDDPDFNLDPYADVIDAEADAAALGENAALSYGMPDGDVVLPKAAPRLDPIATLAPDRMLPDELEMFVEGAAPLELAEYVRDHGITLDGSVPQTRSEVMMALGLQERPENAPRPAFTGQWGQQGLERDAVVADLRASLPKGVADSVLENGRLTILGNINELVAQLEGAQYARLRDFFGGAVGTVEQRRALSAFMHKGETAYILRGFHQRQTVYAWQASDGTRMGVSFNTDRSGGAVSITFGTLYRPSVKRLRGAVDTSAKLGTSVSSALEIISQVAAAVQRHIDEHGAELYYFSGATGKHHAVYAQIMELLGQSEPRYQGQPYRENFALGRRDALARVGGGELGAGLEEFPGEMYGMRQLFEELLYTDPVDGDVELRFRQDNEAMMASRDDALESIYQSAPERPANLRAAAGGEGLQVAGLAWEGRAFLFSDYLFQSGDWTPWRVALHELGAHVGIPEILKGEALSRFYHSVHAGARRADPELRRGFEMAKQAAGPDWETMSPSEQADEAFAYALQTYDKWNNADGYFAAVLRALVHQVRTWAWKYFPKASGVQLRFDDMVYLAMGALRHTAKNKPRYISSLNPGDIPAHWRPMQARRNSGEWNLDEPLYRGHPAGTDIHAPRGMETWASTVENMARGYNENVTPVFARGRIFDGSNPEHLADLLNEVKRTRPAHVAEKLERSLENWTPTGDTVNLVEPYRGELQALGYDGMRVREDGIVNVGVFDKRNLIRADDLRKAAFDAGAREGAGSTREPLAHWRPIQARLNSGDPTAIADAELAMAESAMRVIEQCKGGA